MKKLFEDYSINYSSGRNLIEEIISCDEVAMHRLLIRYLGIVLNMRYSSKEDGEDFILSPIADKNGDFFCSKNAPINMPQDADANGAYHIAKKGLYVIRKLQETGKVECKVTNKEWLNFVTN